MLRQLLVRPILGVFEQHDFRVAPRQLFDRLPHHCLLFIGQQPTERIWLASCTVARRQPIGVPVEQLSSPALPPPILQRRHDHQPIQPTCRLRRVAKLIALSPARSSPHPASHRPPPPLRPLARAPRSAASVHAGASSADQSMRLAAGSLGRTVDSSRGMAEEIVTERGGWLAEILADKKGARKANAA